MKISLVFFVTFFQLLTLILYYFGPLSYVGKPKSIAVAFFVTYYLAALNFGYILAKNFIFRGVSGQRNELKFVKICIISTFFFFPIDFYQKIGSFDFSLSVGELYNNSSERQEDSDSFVAYIKMFYGHYLFGLLPMMLLFFSRIKKIWRFWGIIAIMSNVVITVLTGVNKILFDYVIVLTVFLLNKFTIKDFFKFKGLSFAMIVMVIMTTASSFFVEGQLTRYGSSAISGENPKMGSYSEYNIDDGKLKVFYSAMTGYLTQGYRAFDLALDKPYDFTWGVGNSTFFSRQADRIFDENISEKTYPAKIEEDGWDRYVYWSSFYVWWASDLTFIGVGFLMFLMGFLFRAIENTKNKYNDASSSVLYYYFVIMLFYLSANNQIFQSGQNAMGFLFLLIPLLFRRKLLLMRRPL